MNSYVSAGGSGGNLRGTSMMVLGIVGAIVGIGEAFMLWVLFKLSGEFGRKNFPKPGVGHAPPKPQVEKVLRNELETAEPFRAPAHVPEMRKG